MVLIAWKSRRLLYVFNHAYGDNFITVFSASFLCLEWIKITVDQYQRKNYKRRSKMVRILIESLENLWLNDVAYFTLHFMMRIAVT